MVPTWSVPKKTEAVSWADVLALPLKAYEERTKEFATVVDWTNRAMSFDVTEATVEEGEPTGVAQLVRLMQLLLYSIDFDAGQLAEKLQETKAELRKAKTVAAKASTGTGELEAARDEAQMETRRVKELLDAQESDNSLLRQEVHELRQNLQKAKKDKERAEASAATAEVSAKRFESEVELLRQAASSQRKETSDLAVESTKASLLVQSLAEQVRDLRNELEAQQQKSKRIEVASAAQVQEARRQSESLRLQVVTLEEDLQSAEAGRERAEAAVVEVEREAAESMTRLENLSEQMLAEKQREVDNVQDQLHDAQEDLRALRGNGEGNSADNATVSALRAELKKKDHSIEKLQDALEEAAREAEAATAAINRRGGASGGGGAGGAGLADKERKELLMLRQEVVRVERDLDEVSSDLHKKEKLLSLYRDKDGSIESLSEELDLMRRATDNLEAVNEQLNERLGSHDDVIEYCESLKALCRRIGVTDAELEELNIRGARTEVQTLRQQVMSQQEEIEWLERERKHWIQKVRLQPLLEAQLQLKIGLSPEQKKIVDDIVDNMRSGTYVHDDGVDQANADFREKYHAEVRKRESENKAFNEIVLSKLEAGMASMLKKQQEANGGAGAHGVSPAVADELKQLLEASLQRNGAGGGGGGASSELVGELKSSMAEQQQVLRSQSDRLERMDNTLAEQLHELQIQRERTRDAEEALRTAGEERDRFRECLVGRGEPGASYTAAAASEAHTVGSPMRATPMRQSSVFLNNSTSSAHFTSGAHAAADQTVVDQLIAIEHGLRKQVRNKETAIRTLEQRVRDAEAATAGVREEKDGVAAELKTARLTIVDHERNEADLRALLDETSAKVEEIEKVRSDLRATANDKRLVEKIVQLRSRESKLMTRVRLLNREKEDADRRCARLEDRVATTLEELKKAVAGDSQTCLPTRTTRLSEETVLVGFLQDAVRRLNNGELLEADRQVVDDMNRLLATAADHQANFVAAADIAALRAELESARTKVVSLEAQLGARDAAAAAAEIDRESAKSGGGDDGKAARRVAELEVDSETWRLKTVSLEARVRDKDAEIERLDEQLAASRADLREVKTLFATRNATSANAATTSSTPGSDPLHVPSGTVPPLTADTSMSADQNGRVRQSQLVKQLETEVARMKSTNITLLQSLIDSQVDRRRVESDLRASTTQLHLLTEQTTPLQERAVELVAKVMREHAALQQEILLATSQAKGARLRATSAEANVRILVNEAGTHKLAAYRLYTSYVDHVVGIAQQCRASFRQRDGALTLRAAKETHGRMASLAQRLEGIERLHQGTLGTCAELQAQLRAAEGDVETLQASMHHANERSLAAATDAQQQRSTSGGDAPSFTATARGVETSFARDASMTSFGLPRYGGAAGNTAAEAARTQQIADLRAKNTMLERRAAEAAEEATFAQARVERAEYFAGDVVAQLSRLEVLGAAVASPFGAEEAAERLIQRLAELRDSVHAKGTSPPVALNLTTRSSAQGAATPHGGTSKDEEETLRHYHEALTQHADLLRERGELQANLETGRQQIAMLDARCGALREELNHSEQRGADVLKQLEEEKAKAARREERVHQAHAQQQRIMASAGEHNVKCLKEMVAAKERVIAQLQTQLEADRTRHLEAAMVDSTRLERLHDQLHRETASLVERFRIAVDSGRAAGGNGGSGALAESEAGVLATLREALQQSSDREAMLAKEAHELRARNSELQRMLRENAGMSHHAPPHSAHTPPAMAGSGTETPVIPTLSAAPMPRLDAIVQCEILTAAGATTNAMATSTAAAGASGRPQMAEAAVSAMMQQSTTHTGTAMSPQRHAVPPLPLADGQALRAQDRTEAEWVALKSELAGRDEEVKKLAKELRRAERENARQKKKSEATAFLKVNVPKSEENVPPVAGGGSSTAAKKPDDAAKLRAEIEQATAAAESERKRRREAERTLATERDAAARKELARRNERLEALEKQSALERRVSELVRSTRTTPRASHTPPPPPVQPAASAAAVPSATAAPSPADPADPAAPEAATATLAPKAIANEATTTPPVPAADAAGPDASGVNTSTASVAAQRPDTAAAVPPPSSSLARASEPRETASESRTQSPGAAAGGTTNALATRMKILERKLAEAQAKLGAQDVLHKKEMLRLMDSRKALEAQLAGEQRRPGAVRTAAPATGGAVRPPSVGGSRAAVEAAAVEVRLREQIAQMKREMATMTADHAAAKKREDALAAEAKQSAELREKCDDLLTRLKVSETLRTGQGAATGAIATLRELRHHKTEMLAVERQLDDAKLTDHRQRGEIEKLTRQCKEASEELDKLRADNAALRAGVTPPSDDEAKKAAASAAASRAKDKRIRELEDVVLQKDGAILDLRFERETLDMRASRAERHLEELVATERREGASSSSPSGQRAATGRSAAGNGGATPRGGNVPPHLARAHEVGRVAQLEAVVENMKSVVERLHRENELLKATGVAGSRYVEATREVRHLRIRERELQEMVQQLNLKLAHAQSSRTDPLAAGRGSRSHATAADQHLLLQRRLRAAEAAADRFKDENARLRDALAPPAAPTRHLDAGSQNPNTGGATLDGAATVTATGEGVAEMLAMGESAHFPELIKPEHWERRFASHHQDEESQTQTAADAGVGTAAGEL